MQGKGAAAAAAAEARERSSQLSTSASTRGVSFAGAAFQADYFASKFTRRGQLAYAILYDLRASLPWDSAPVLTASGVGASGIKAAVKGALSGVTKGDVSAQQRAQRTAQDSSPAGTAVAQKARQRKEGAGGEGSAQVAAALAGLVAGAASSARCAQVAVPPSEQVVAQAAVVVKAALIAGSASAQAAQQAAVVLGAAAIAGPVTAHAGTRVVERAAMVMGTALIAGAAETSTQASAQANAHAVAQTAVVMGAASVAGAACAVARVRTRAIEQAAVVVSAAASIGAPVTVARLVRVASFGGGPGTDAAGLVWIQRDLFPALRFECTLYDYEASWKRYLKTLGEVFGERVGLSFLPCDVTQPLGTVHEAGGHAWGGVNCKIDVSESDLILFFYVCHETSLRQMNLRFYADVAAAAKAGAVVVLADVKGQSAAHLGRVVAAMAAVRAILPLRLSKSHNSEVLAFCIAP